MKKLLTLGVVLCVAYYFKKQIIIGVLAIYWLLLPDSVKVKPSEFNTPNTYDTEQIYSDTTLTDTLNLK
jgi:hypothetical protein